MRVEWRRRKTRMRVQWRKRKTRMRVERTSRWVVLYYYRSFFSLVPGCIQSVSSNSQPLFALHRKSSHLSLPLNINPPRPPRIHKILLHNQVPNPQLSRNPRLKQPLDPARAPYIRRSAKPGKREERAGTHADEDLLGCVVAEVDATRCDRAGRCECDERENNATAKAKRRVCIRGMRYVSKE
jgi:hypothetical protein